MIQVDKLEFQYPNSDKETLKGLSFEIKKGEIFGFLGPSGAGKSTTQKVLYKILSGYNGSVIIDGKDIKDWNNSYFEKIGVGFEFPNHYLKLTGKENMELFASFYKNGNSRNLSELFEMVDLQDAINKPVDAYSKGMKVRLNFIRAIQHNPDILFFDEPTSGLDPVNAHKIKQHILNLKSQGKTVFITTHSMEIADQLCDRVSFIVDGKLQATDKPENFKKEFVDYYTTEKYSQNTMQRELGLIKTFCKYAQKKGLDVHSELLDLKLKKKPVQSIYLSFTELERIEKADLKHEYQENARDWLIISCYTGQRISDFLRFTSNLIRVENGKTLLEFKQKKTGKLMTIPVHPKVMVILNKRNGEFPRAISDQRYNEYIKKVCRLAQLKKKVDGKKQVDINPNGKESKIRAVAGTFEKWELVTSHIGRRSFATNFYGKIPTTYLIYVTGHSSESMFLNYIGKSNKDLAIELTNYF